MSEGAPIPDPYAPAPRPRPAPPAPAPGPPRTSGMAIGSVVLGVLGFTCFPAVGGLVALTLGVAARGEIARSEGARTGSGLALAGATLGALNLLGSVVGLALLLHFAGSSTSSPPPRPPPGPPVAAPGPFPTASPAPTATPAPSASSARSSRQGGVIRTRLGKVDLVDIDADVPSLAGELATQRTEAARDGKKVLLWVVVDDCLPCNGVSASLSDAKMQAALEQVRLVRVDARDFAQELTSLGVPVEKVPGFALLGEGNRPVDYVNGGEWDDDIPRNIAPVLGNFVRGRYDKRRDPWRRAVREDETAL